MPRAPTARPVQRGDFTRWARDAVLAQVRDTDVDAYAPRDAAAFGRDDRLGASIGSAVRPDCRTAYASYGLLGLPLLVADAVRSRGCAW